MKLKSVQFSTYFNQPLALDALVYWAGLGDFICMQGLPQMEITFVGNILLLQP